MRVALVHDYLREYGGAERVLEVLHEMFPDAPVFVALYDPKKLGKHAKRFESWDISQTKLKNYPFAKSLLSPYRVFASRVFEALDLSEFDVVISSTNMYMAKAVKVGKNAKHFSYVHTPPRSLYGYSTMSNWRKNVIIRLVGEAINTWMRYVDFQTAQRPDVLIANSKTTQQRISKFYRRDSVVISPPVDLVDQKLEVMPQQERTYALFAGRLAFSKHPELAVNACQTLGIPLKVVGTGALLEDLKQLAGPETEILGSVSDKLLMDLYQHAQFVICPADEEDFGIVPIESMAAGTPVLVHSSGEPRFTVKHGVTGLHVPTLRPNDWLEAVRVARDTKWKYASIQESVQKFSSAEFTKKILGLVRAK